ncbi:ligase-associated DNA damage response endonuclease PdeM [Azoarcus olearius]|uniref:Calcineurin-like phosphoesterase domain-containing protein n=1 Tax=Azoarcus sp. (strain BH72) TaxID=418699 RepID=A1K2K8_AZOSB|nr:ligase-associated DNA damage response endonuclease PdeM [Azoarcus olearius]CAL93063.1 conserved hypothetical protein [Azoarcus olearius]
MPAHVDLERAGLRLRLLPERAVWWADEATLFIADPHFGKAAAYRALGQPVPRGTTGETLARLDRLLAQWPARRLVVLGDFLHAPEAHAPATLAAMQRWRERHPRLDCVLVRGNHDDRAGDPPPALGIAVVDEPLALGPLRLWHAPPPPERVPPGCFALGGHLHPAYVLRTRHERLRLPCYLFGPAVGVLPAFGAFTGSAEVWPGPLDTVCVVGDGEVFRVAG